MVHLVPDEGVDDGPVLATAPSRSSRRHLSLTERVHETRTHAAEHRLFVQTMINPAAPTTQGAACRDRRPQPVFDRFEALTFDDVVVVPGYSESLPDAVDTTATFAADIELAVPLVSAAMDMVTEARMAIAMARNGGLGVIHRNLTVDEQAAEVLKVKRTRAG